jgi:hypothetical protein
LSLFSNYLTTDAWYTRISLQSGAYGMTARPNFLHSRQGPRSRNSSCPVLPVSEDRDGDLRGTGRHQHLRGLVSGSSGR